jgi:hypothetical protein
MLQSLSGCLPVGFIEGAQVHVRNERICIIGAANPARAGLGFQLQSLKGHDLIMMPYDSVQTLAMVARWIDRTDGHSEGTCKLLTAIGLNSALDSERPLISLI